MEVKEKTLLIFGTKNGEGPFAHWIRKLKDERGRQIIQARLARVKLGSLGDHKSVGEGVVELRVHFGPGYRIYIGQDGELIVVLLCGGDKSSQKNDIQNAKKFWQEYKKGKALCPT
jgi:putative addiction module killer protein